MLLCRSSNRGLIEVLIHLAVRYRINSWPVRFSRDVTSEVIPSASPRTGASSRVPPHAMRSEWSQIFKRMVRSQRRRFPCRCRVCLAVGLGHGGWVGLGWVGLGWDGSSLVWWRWRWRQMGRGQPLLTCRRLEVDSFIAAGGQIHSTHPLGCSRCSCAFCESSMAIGS